uniref:Uncharacterized protein n=1 Tax=Anopheles melas TaxID=34690 RepID=A0A182TRE8_9DIPT
TRGRGRGRGRGKLSLADGAGSVFGGTPIAGASPVDGNVDPLFIGTPNSHNPSTDAMQGFQLLFGHLQTPRGAGGSARSRGGRRGAGSRGPRTPRGGRGAAKAAMAAMLAAASATPPADLVGSFADLTAAEEAAKSQLLDALQQQQEQLLQQQMPLSPVGAVVDVTPKPRGRGRGTRGTTDRRRGNAYELFVARRLSQSRDDGLGKCSAFWPRLAAAAALLTNRANKRIDL